MAPSILDGLPTSEAQGRAVTQIAEQVLDETLSRLDLSPRQRSIADLVRKGLSLADIFQISPRHREALLLQGCRLLQIGKIQAAKDLLTTLTQIDPLNAPALYALAACHQAAGEPEAAGKIYVSAIALDATNPEGYLRLGECFLANGEIARALECFESVRDSAASKPAQAAQHAHALVMIAAVQARAET